MQNRQLQPQEMYPEELKTLEVTEIQRMGLEKIKRKNQQTESDHKIALELHQQEIHEQETLQQERLEYRLQQYRLGQERLQQERLQQERLQERLQQQISQREIIKKLTNKYERGEIKNESITSKVCEIKIYNENNQLQGKGKSHIAYLENNNENFLIPFAELEMEFQKNNFYHIEIKLFSEENYFLYGNRKYRLFLYDYDTKFLHQICQEKNEVNFKFIEKAQQEGFDIKGEVYNVMKYGELYYITPKSLAFTFASLEFFLEYFANKDNILNNSTYTDILILYNNKLISYENTISTFSIIIKSFIHLLYCNIKKVQFVIDNNLIYFSGMFLIIEAKDIQYLYFFSWGILGFQYIINVVDSYFIDILSDSWMQSINNLNKYEILLDTLHNSLGIYNNNLQFKTHFYSKIVLSVYFTFFNDQNSTFFNLFNLASSLSMLFFTMKKNNYSNPINNESITTPQKIVFSLVMPVFKFQTICALGVNILTSTLKIFNNIVELFSDKEIENTYFANQEKIITNVYSINSEKIYYDLWKIYNNTNDIDICLNIKKSIQSVFIKNNDIFFNVNTLFKINNDIEFYQKEELLIKHSDLINNVESIYFQDIYCDLKKEYLELDNSCDSYSNHDQNIKNIMQSFINNYNHFLNYNCEIQALFE